MVIEGAIFTAPSVVLLCWGLPQLIILTVLELRSPEASSLSVVAVISQVAVTVGASFSVTELWRAILRSAMNERYEFGYAFWLALIFGLTGTGAFAIMSNIVISLAVVGPLAVPLFHVVVRQWSCTREKSR